MTTMLDSLANEIEAACNVRAYGLYDYSDYPEVPGGLKCHVVRDEITRGNQVVFESNDPSEARQWYDAACRRFIARAALQAIREPSDSVLAAMDKARPLWSSPSCDNKRELIMSRNLPKAQAFVDAILDEKSE